MQNGQEQKKVLVTAKNGRQMLIPEDRLGAWKQAQKEEAPLTESEKQLISKIVSDVYSSTK